MKKVPISQIYQTFNIPKNLAMHMLWVTSIGALTIENWSGPVIDRDRVISALLLHDIGNLIKFELSSSQAKKLYSKQELKKLVVFQKQMIGFYGDNADIANILILQELQVNKQIIQLLENHSFDYLPTLLDSENWNEKIVFYADLRVAPWGIVSVAQRVKNLRERYCHRNPDWNNNSLYKKWLNWSTQLEDQLNQQTKIDLESIPQNRIEEKVLALSDYKISVEV